MYTGTLNSYILLPQYVFKYLIVIRITVCFILCSFVCYCCYIFFLPLPILSTGSRRTSKGVFVKWHSCSLFTLRKLEAIHLRLCTHKHCYLSKHPQFSRIFFLWGLLPSNKEQKEPHYWLIKIIWWPAMPRAPCMRVA